MSHESVWNSRPRGYGKGARSWYAFTILTKPLPSLSGAKEREKRNDFEEDYRDSHEKTTDGKDGIQKNQ